MMNKKGELSSSQLVTIIILIVSFAVILIFFYIFNFKGEVTKESCRNSVVLRGTALSKSVVQLQCETKDVCFSKTGNCDSAKKGTEVIKVADKTALMNELGTLMYDCWWQMGEGKVDYRASGIGNSESYCAVCNSVKFDSSVKNSGDMNSISLADLYGSLQNRRVQNKDMNYLQYLYGFNNLQAVRDNILAVSQNYGKQIDIDNQKLDLADGDLALITALTKSGWAIPIAGGVGGGVVGGATGYFVSGALVASGPVGWVVGAGIAGGAAIAGTIAYKSTENDVAYMPPAFYGYNSADFKGLNCKEFSTLS